MDSANNALGTLAKVGIDILIFGATAIGIVVLANVVKFIAETVLGFI